jgi:hypothetical protein
MNDTEEIGAVAMVGDTIVHGVAGMTQADAEAFVAFVERKFAGRLSMEANVSEFREEDHPRGEGGRWTSGGDVAKVAAGAAGRATLGRAWNKINKERGAIRDARKRVDALGNPINPLAANPEGLTERKKLWAAVQKAYAKDLERRRQAGELPVKKPKPAEPPPRVEPQQRQQEVRIKGRQAIPMPMVRGNDSQVAVAYVLAVGSKDVNPALVAKAGEVLKREEDAYNEAKNQARANGKVWNRENIILRRIEHVRLRNRLNTIERRKGEAAPPKKEAKAGNVADPSKAETPRSKRLANVINESTSESHELGGGIEKTLLVTFKDKDGYETKSVWKRGEASRPHVRRNIDLIGNCNGAEREEASYKVATALGIEYPAVTKGDFGGVSGSYMEFVPNSKNGFDDHGKAIRQPSNGYRVGELAALDVIIGNEDRHGGNYMVESNGTIHPIDGGLSFPDRPTFFGNESKFIDSVCTDHKHNKDAETAFVTVLKKSNTSAFSDQLDKIAKANNLSDSAVKLVKQRAARVLKMVEEHGFRNISVRNIYRTFNP